MRQNLQHVRDSTNLPASAYLPTSPSSAYHPHLPPNPNMSYLSTNSNLSCHPDLPPDPNLPHHHCFPGNR